MRLLKCTAVLSLAVFHTFCASAPAQEAARASSTITEPELRQHIFFLASDALRGRKTGTEGYSIAAQYCASQFLAAGLEPGARTPDGEKTYLQRISLQRKEVLEGSGISLSTPAGEETVELGPMASILNLIYLDGVSLPLSDVVFAGYGIHEPELGYSDYEGLDVSGKMVVVICGAPAEQGAELAALYGQTGEPSVARRVRAAASLGAAAVAFVRDWALARVWSGLQGGNGHDELGYEASDSVEVCGGIPTLVLHPTIVGKLFAGTGVDPVAMAAGKGEADIEGFALEGVKLGVTANISNEDIEAYNVVAMLPGTDPELAGQVITLGAHLDHIGAQGDVVFNGADDNASGSIAVLEIAEALITSPTRRPVVFVLYAAEEIGLLGSRYFTDHPPVPIEDIMVNINLDMVSRSDAMTQDDRAIHAIGSDIRCPELKAALVRVQAETAGWPLDFELDSRGGKMLFENNSDQANFHNKGIPAVFFFSGVHRDLHRPTDDPEKVDFEKFLGVSRLVCDLVTELGNAERPLRARQ